MQAFAKSPASQRETASLRRNGAAPPHRANTNPLWVAWATAPAIQRKCTECQHEDEQARVQPRLKVGRSDDAHEREADAIAHRVMGKGPEVSEPSPSLASGGSPGVVRASPSAAKPSHGHERGIAAGVSPAVLTRGGNPLPEGTRQYYESRMGRDFSSVRLHRGEQSNRLNHALGARAFTFLDHVWLGDHTGHEPNFVLAHELAHVMQQTSPGSSGSIQTSAAPPTIQRLVPPGNCEQTEHDTMQRAVKAICDPPEGIAGGSTRTWRQCQATDSCGQLGLKIFRNQMCALRRKSINDKCYDGGDIGHKIAERDARLAQANCMALFRAKCESKPTPEPDPIPVPTPSRAAQRVGVSALIGAGLGGVLGALIGGAGGAAGGTLVAPGVGTVGGGAAGGTAGAIEGAALGAAAGAAVGALLQSAWEWVSD